MKLDLVIVNPGHRTVAYQGLGDELAAIEPPVWAGLIATYVRKKGYSVALIDANAEDVSPEDVAVRIQSMKPILVAIVVYGHNPSASTQVMPAAGATCSAIKNLDPSTTILLVGGHVAALPERSLREEEADYVCGGEGPITVVDLIEALRDTAQPDLRRVRDLWYRDGESVRQSAPAPLVESLDRDLSGIAWDLLPMRRYRAHNWHCFQNVGLRQPYAALYTTLGCPFHCSFCCIQAPFKRGERVLNMQENLNSYRYWSPQTVLAEIDRMVTTYGVRNFKFADEMFVLNRKHVHAICRGLIDRRYDLNIWAYARVDTVRDDTADIMRQAGIKWLAFGIEAANARVRDGVEKGYDQGDIFTTIERVRKAGTSVAANYMFGLPDDDLTSMQATLALAQDLNTEYANFYCTMAYPGSALYRQALQDGWPLPDRWSGYSQHAADSFPLPTKHLTSVDVLRFRDAAFLTYFLNPRYQHMMRERFGDETVAHINRMSQQRLSRVAIRPEQTSIRLTPASPSHSVIPVPLTRGVR
jgi:anaerobic magnesium-protoporphyrin IX monomethyl ester cyclase